MGVLINVRALSILLVGAALAWSQDTAVLRVGLVAPFSGAHALRGASLKQGVDLALEEWNAGNRVLGRKVELVRADDKGASSLAAPACSKLIVENHVSAIIGSVSPEACFEAAVFCQRSRIPLIVPATSDPKIAEVGDQIFRTSSSDAFLAVGAAQYAADNLKASTAACIFSQKRARSERLAKIFGEAFTASGRQMSVYDGKAWEDGRPTDLIRQVVEKGPDVLYLPEPSAEAVVFMKNLRAAGYSGAILGGDTWGDDPSMLASMTDQVGLLYTGQSTLESALGSGFSARFQARYGHSADTRAAQGYDAAVILLAAMQQSSSVEKTSIRDALAGTDVHSLSGRLRFDKDGDAVKPVPVLLYTRGGSSLKAMVEPLEPGRITKFTGRHENTSGPTELQLGFLAPLTGEAASFGRSAQLGAWMAVAEWNAAGGVLGKWIKMHSADDQGSPSVGAEACRKLIVEDKAFAIAGTIMSKVCLAAAPVCEAFRVPMVSPTATNPKVTECGNYIFRACFIDPYQGIVGAKFAFRNLKLRRAACLFDGGNVYTRELSEAFRNTFRDLGGEVVAFESHKGGLTDFKDHLQRTLLTEPEVLFISDYYNDAAVIVRQARHLGFTGAMIGGDGWDSPKLAELAGRAVEGCYLINHFALDNPSQASKDFVAKYQLEHRSQPDAIAVLAYDSVNLILKAVQRAGTADGPAVQAELLRLEADTVCGQLKFDSQRNPIKPAVILQIRNGKQVHLATVEP